LATGRGPPTAFYVFTQGLCHHSPIPLLAASCTLRARTVAALARNAAIVEFCIVFVNNMLSDALGQDRDRSLTAARAVG
jgi:hypothetical protein